jgi:hypothetical protein
MSTEEIQAKREKLELQISEAKIVQDMIDQKLKDTRYIEKSEMENYEISLKDSYKVLHLNPI